MVKKATNDNIKVFYDFIETSSKLNGMTLVFSPSLEGSKLITNDKVKKEDVVLYTSSELLYLRGEFALARKLGNVRKIRERFSIDFKEHESKALTKYYSNENTYIGELEKLVRKYLEDFELLYYSSLRPTYISKDNYSRFTDNQKKWLEETYSLFKFNNKVYLNFKDENLEKNVKLAVTNQPMALLLNYVTPDYHKFVLLLNRHLGDIPKKGLYAVLNTTQEALPSKDLEKHKEMLTRGIDALDNLSIFIKNRQADAYRYTTHTRTKQEGYSK